MFTNNLIQYCKKGDAGQCPFCGNSLKVDKVPTPTRENLVITCESCNKSDFFSGVIKVEDSNVT